jgi:hypothetical protein
MLISVNAEALNRSTRRGPSKPPRYTENGPMNIMAALNAVPIHDASSTPRCNAPLRSTNPTLIRRPAKDAIMAPSNTPKIPMIGREVIITDAGDGDDDPILGGGALTAEKAPFQRVYRKREW